MASGIFVGSVYATMELQTGGFAGDIARAQRTLQEFDKQTLTSTKNTTSFAKDSNAAFGSIADGLGSILKPLILVTTAGSVGFAAMAKASYDQVRQVEDATFALRAYEKDGKKVNTILKDLVAYARSDLGVLFQRDELFKAASNLRGFGEEADKITDRVKILSKGVALGMTNFDELSQIMGRSAAAGKLTSVAYDQLAYRGIVLDSSLRGASLSADELYAALDSAISDKVLEGRANTISGMIIRMQSAFRDLGAAILGVDADTTTFIKGGLGDTLVNGFSDLTQTLKDPSVKLAMQDLGDTLANFAKSAVPTFVNGLLFMGKNMQNIIPIIAGLSAAFAVAKIGETISSIADAVDGLGQRAVLTGAVSKVAAKDMNSFTLALKGLSRGALFAGGLVALVGVLTFLELRFGLVSGAIKLFGDVAMSVFNSVSSVVAPIIQSISEWFSERLSPAVTDFINTIKGQLQPILNNVSGIFAAFGAVAAASVPILQRFVPPLQAIGRVAKTVGLFVAKIFGNVIVIGIKVMLTAFKAILPAVNFVLSAIRAGLEAVAWGINQLLPLWELTKSAVKTAGAAFVAVKDAVVDFINSGLNVLSDAFEAARQKVIDYRYWIRNTAIVLGVIFGPLMLKIATQTIASWVRIASAAVVNGAKSAAAWVSAHARMGASAIKNGAIQTAQAIKSGAVWLKNAAVAAPGWILAHAKMGAAAIKNGAIQAFQAARSGLAWARQAVFAGGVVIGQFIAMAARAVATGVVMAAQAAASGYAWLLAGARIAAMNAIMLVVRGATLAWTAAQWLLNVALNANPIGLIIGLVIALVAGFVLLWRNSETFRNIVTGAFNAVWGAVKAVFNWVKSNWPLLLAILTGPIGIAVLLITKNWGKIRAGFSAVVSFIRNIWGKITGFFSSIGGRIGNVFSNIVNTIKSKFISAVNFVRGIPGKILGALGNAGGLLKDYGRNMIQGLIDGAGSLLKNIGTFFLDKIPGWIKGPFKKALGISSPSKVFAGYGVNIMEGAIMGIQDKQRSMQRTMYQASDNVSRAFNPSLASGALDYSRIRYGDGAGSGSNSKVEMYGNINLGNDVDADRFLTNAGLMREGQLVEKGMAI